MPSWNTTEQEDTNMGKSTKKKGETMQEKENTNNKAEAQKLTKEIINYFTEILHFEHPDDIRITVVDHPDEGVRSQVFTQPGYMVYDISINISNNEISLLTQICHELSHILLGEFTQAFHEINGFDDDESTDFKIFVRASERSALRLGRLLEKMWNIRHELEKLEEYLDAKK
jgi:hypothetical protein